MTYEQALVEMKKGRLLTRPYSTWTWRYDSHINKLVITRPLINFCVFIPQIDTLDEEQIKEIDVFRSWLEATDWIYAQEDK